MNGYVYIIHALTTNYYKIGITIGNIEKRLHSLRATIPFWDLKLVVAHYCDDCGVLEKQLHEKCSGQRLRNSEWFVFMDDELEELIESNGLVSNHEPSPPPIPKNANWSKHSTTLHDFFPIHTDSAEKANTKPIIDSATIQAKELDPLRERLTHLREELRMKWREIGEMPEFNGVSFGTLNAIYHGREPKIPSVRRKLGLPATEYIPQIRNELGRFAKQ